MAESEHLRGSGLSDGSDGADDRPGAFAISEGLTGVTHMYVW